MIAITAGLIIGLTYFTIRVAAVVLLMTTKIFKEGTK